MYARLRSVVMLWLPLVLILQLLLLAEPGVAAEKKPKVHRHDLGFRVKQILYFRDSETAIAHSDGGGEFRISHNGGVEWEEPKGVPDRSTAGVLMHPYDNDTAFAISPTQHHWYTTDRGKSWKEFNLEKGLAPSYQPLSFHAGDKNKIIFNAKACIGPLCAFESFYTLDNFKSIKKLKDGTPGGCIWARSKPNFQVRDGDKNDNLILCAVKQDRSILSRAHERIELSNDFFKTESEPALDGANPLTGAFELAAIQGYLVIARRSSGTSQLALYVSDDGFQWDQAEFENDHKIDEKAYTILESTAYSIQVHVKTEGSINEMGTVLSSNSNGTYFHKNIEHVNRNRIGFVDFEKISGIQGIYLVNTVHNYEDVLKSPFTVKKLESHITFDDGHSFQPLKLLDKDGKKTDKKVHLYSVTHLTNSGRVYSSPAPGIVMGIGNEGDYLKDFKEGNLYVSDDAGLTWRLAREGTHKYEFGDQGSVLMAISDKEATKGTNKAVFSMKHGQEWEEFDFEKAIVPDILTTVPDSTSLKFILTGLEKGKDDEAKGTLYVIDFEGLHERDCGNSDFEEWVARKDKDGEPDCLMGHTQSYRRRKADVACFVNHEFKQSEIKEESCKCTKEDFECDYNFMPDGDGGCKATKVLKPPKDACKKDDGDEKFKQAPFRKIPGNTCHDGVDLDKEEREFKCKDSTRPGKPGPASGEIANHPKTFDGKMFGQKVYLERADTASGNDETIMVETDRELYISRDSGKTWKVQKFDDSIRRIIPHPYNNDMVFVITDSKRVHYSVNRGGTFHSFEVPAEAPASFQAIYGFPLAFHVTEDNWLIWMGQEKNHYRAWYSKSRGEKWEPLRNYITRCEFIKRPGWDGKDERILCQQHEGEDPKGTMELVSSDDWFGKAPEKHFQNVLTFTTMAEFIIVAYKDKNQNLKIDASMDGKQFADAQFPKDFKVPPDVAYTVVESSTNSIFLVVSPVKEQNMPHGRLMKSNSNGTSYVSLIDAVNQNDDGYVDFQKMQDVAGVAIVNVVGNADDTKTNKKQLQTRITHNDGTNWQLITDVKDLVDKGFDCHLGPGCSLNLHGYLDRTHAQDTLGSTSGIGLIMGNGNVGEYLDGEGDTFISRNGGVEWYRVKKGRYLWKYGDQGSIIVVVKENDNTDTLSYSEDEGQTWKDHTFHTAKIKVSDLTTVPSDKSRSFIVWGKDGDNELIGVTVDFSGLRNRICEVDEKEAEKENGGGDYYHWTPEHPFIDNDCLFGHKTVLHRKRPGSDCWNDLKLDPLHSDLTQNCTCSRNDFECDYNFELTADNTCQLVSGLHELDPVQVCKDDSERISYFESKGYRKIPISTCHGGEAGRFLGEEKACPDKKEQFDAAQPGLRGFALFLVAFVLPCVAAGGIGWWVYQRWDGKFGRIRLGETPSLGSRSGWDADQPWIRYPVAAIAGVVAVAAAVPLLLGAAWRQLRSRMAGSRRYTTRESFARSRGEYAVVDPVEDELLGEDDDDF